MKNWQFSDSPPQEFCLLSSVPRQGAPQLLLGGGLGVLLHFHHSLLKEEPILLSIATEDSPEPADVAARHKPCSWFCKASLP